MVDPLEELIRQSNEFHNSLIEHNNELDRAFQNGTFGELVQSWGSDDDSGTELEGEDSETLLERESGGASGEPEAGSETV
ncbi:hypothetical protein Pan241w_59440 [Gimesia alba]|uniref:Uncharacterized protein n=1 Tax=Gimesia alba TaxID=2527973 RepID=A0A517RPK2_9PLAN|nr:hypothetical protein [Gimesia alba]QDT45816.1 hypothetical protein Pan241w_59440 [Gimesia alba]